MEFETSMLCMCMTLHWRLVLESRGYQLSEVVARGAVCLVQCHVYFCVCVYSPGTLCLTLERGELCCASGAEQTRVPVGVTMVRVPVTCGCGSADARRPSAPVPFAGGSARPAVA